MKTNRLLLTLGLILALTTVRADDNETRLQLARDVIKASQADKMIDALSGQMQQMAMAGVQSAAKDLPPEKLADAQALQKEVMALTMESAKSLIAKMDAIYAEVYTEGELRAIKAFFESPEGHSMIEKQPQLMQRIMPLAMELQKEVGPKIQALVAKRMAELKAATE